MFHIQYHHFDSGMSLRYEVHTTKFDLTIQEGEIAA